MSRGLAEFVDVIRESDGLKMHIVKHVALKYPGKFKIIPPKVTKRPKATLLKKDKGE